MNYAPQYKEKLQSLSGVKHEESWHSTTHMPEIVSTCESGEVVKSLVDINAEQLHHETE